MVDLLPGNTWQRLRRDGVLVVLDIGGPHRPRIVYWGADLGGLTDDDCLAIARAVAAAQGDPAR